MTKEVSKTRLVLACGFVLSLFLAADSPSEEASLDLPQLQGDWSGEASYLVPFTSISASVDIEASFIYDTTNGYLRTFFTAENLLFGYSDSGHLQINPSGDSAVWEIWNNWGTHSRYSGTVEGNTFMGSARRGKLKYDVYIEVVKTDSINCRVIMIDEKGKSSEQGSCYLQRVTKE